MSSTEAKSALVEIYSPPRVTDVARRFPRYGVLLGGSYDLRVGPDGQSWGFSREDHREEVRERVCALRPYLLIGSPPCTDWCAMNARLSHPRMDPGDVERRVELANVNPQFVASLYWEQFERGCHFLHEHPLTAESWHSAILQPLFDDPRVATVVGHMCRQGMRMPGKDGKVRPVKKATRWAISAECVLKRLGIRCSNADLPPGDSRRHEHTVFEGTLPGGVHRTSRAAMYPARLCHDIFKGVAAQKIREGKTGPPKESGPRGMSSRGGAP